MSAALPLLLIVGAMACVGICVVVALIVVSRRRPPSSSPRCGHCDYNLTGAASNRCPECGRLFIDAGVIPRADTTTLKRNRRGVVLTLAIGLLLLAGLGATFALMRQSTLRAQALAVRQAAMAAQQRARAAAQRASLERAAASAPASQKSTTNPAAEHP